MIITKVLLGGIQKTQALYISHFVVRNLKGNINAIAVCYIITQTISGLEGQWHLSENREQLGNRLIRHRGRRLDMTQWCIECNNPNLKDAIDDRLFLPVNLGKDIAYFSYFRLRQSSVTVKAGMAGPIIVCLKLLM